MKQKLTFLIDVIHSFEITQIRHKHIHSRHYVQIGLKLILNNRYKHVSQNQKNKIVNKMILPLSRVSPAEANLFVRFSKIYLNN